jgi:microcystin-dependent protein
MSKNFPIIKSLAMVASVTVFSGNAWACGTDAYLGQMCVIAGSYCPNGTVEAEGQTLTIAENQALYSLIGATYGGDYRTVFSLPDLRGRTVVGYGQGPGFDLHPMGVMYGREEVTLDVEQMPSHTHEADVSQGGNSVTSVVVKIPVVSTAGAATTNVPGPSTSLATTDPTFDLSAVGGNTSPANIYSTATPTTTLAPFFADISGGASSISVVNEPTGGTKAVGVSGPRIALRWCIVTDGVYPTRPQN